MAHILIIEPDKILAKQYSQALLDDNHKVSLATGAESALPILDEKVDVIVLELQLGQHNGLEFLYEIRSYDDLADVPVIILSNVNPVHVTSAETYKLLTIAAYLYKPETKLSKLRDTVSDTLQARAGKS